MDRPSHDAPPSDGSLQAGFQIDPSLGFEEMARQVSALGALAGSPTLFSKPPLRDPETLGKEKDNRNDPPPSTPLTRSRGRGGRRSKAARGGGTGTRANPVRDNQLEKLTAALAEVDTDDGVPIPDTDALTTKEVDAISARSSRIEETMEEHDLQLKTAGVRIAALETENSLLVGKINVLSQEISKIKEMLPGGSLDRGKATAPQMLKSSTSAVFKTVASSHQNPAPAGPLAPDTGASQLPRVDPDLGSRPVPKRKFLG